MVSLKHVLLFCGIFAFINAFCMPWNSGGVINVCKETFKKTCIGVSSGKTCKNLIGGPFLSGFTSGPYSCTIYNQTSCTGKKKSVDSDGYTEFPFKPKSIECPCV